MKVNAKTVNCNKLICEISPEEKRCPDIRQKEGEFPNLFKRKGRVKNYETKSEMEEGAKITQQKGRRISIQLQNQLDNESGKLLKEGHIENNKESR